MASIFLVLCESWGEDAHVIGVFSDSKKAEGGSESDSSRVPDSSRFGNHWQARRRKSRCRDPTHWHALTNPHCAEFKAAKHDEDLCPRSWAYGAFGRAPESHAVLLMTDPSLAKPADAKLSSTDHELRVVSMSLTGKPVSNCAWIVLGSSGHIGELFESAVSRAFSTKEAALKFMKLPVSASPPTRDGGTKSPLCDLALHGEARVLLRAYPVSGWEQPATGM
jgi:hypothetical protein